MAKKPLRIFISATGQNAGKTTFSLGLISALLKKFKTIGFIKPIGQRYLMEQGFKVDEDSILMEHVYGMSGNLSIKDLSPVAVERGFTEKYIEGSAKGDYAKEILDAFDRVARDSEIVVIEGTGHAGVGSVFDLSNATVAKLLDAKVVLLTPGGVGRPIDEAMLNKPLFDEKGVELAGVIVNKVLPQKFDRIAKYVRMGFKRKNIPVLGVMPYQKRLELPTVREIHEEGEFRVLCGEKYLDKQVDKILVGAMEFKDAMRYMVNNSLIITAFDRMDMIQGVIDVQKGKIKRNCSISGLILSGDNEPPKEYLDVLEECRVATLLADSDTYSVAAELHSMKVKIKPEDKNKISIIKKMVSRYVDMNRIIESITA